MTNLITLLKYFLTKNTNSKVKTELEILLKYLNQSRDSAYAYDTVEDIKNIVNDIINEINDNKTINKEKIEFLFVPTGSLQDTSIDNGWGEKFLVIANKIEKMIGTH
ncbi:MAG: hypothetical protein LBU34_06345 [Planctomycetaceae bacterium]|nr:hypothetical protein [Planctomycetaceae bacterium]